MRRLTAALPLRQLRVPSSFNALPSSRLRLECPQLSASHRPLHTSSPPSLEAEPAQAVSSSSPPPSPPTSLPPTSSTSTSPLPSQWYPATPSSISPTAARRLRRRLRHANPAHPPLHTLAHLDPTSLTITYSPPTIPTPTSPTPPPRRYQLHVPAPSVVCSFRIVHAAKEYIHQACVVFEEQANKLNLYLTAVVPLPTRTQSWTLLRSPHVDKQSREQYEIKRHKRLLTITLDAADLPHQAGQVKKLMARCTGMISERMTATYRVPAGVGVETMTFGRGGKEGWVGGDDLAETGLGEDPYEAEDEEELTEEEDQWGEDLEEEFGSEREGGGEELDK